MSSFPQFFAEQQDYIQQLNNMLAMMQAGQPLAGEIRQYGGAAAPSGWAICDGAALNEADHAALFAVIGHTYGTAGSGTFKLPDLRGRMPRGADSVHAMGDAGGADSVTIGTTNLPSHGHNATFSGASVSADLMVSTTAPATAGATPQLVDGQTAWLANAAAGTLGNALKGLYTTSQPAAGSIAHIAVNMGAITGGTVNIGNTGGGTALNVTAPYLAVNFIICLG